MKNSLLVNESLFRTVQISNLQISCEQRPLCIFKIHGEIHKVGRQTLRLIAVQMNGEMVSRRR